MSFNAFQLKLLAAALMTLDHIQAYFPDSVPLTFHWLGRLSAPIFFFLLIEGYAFTRNRRRYLLRLAAGAAVMAAGSTLLLYLLPGGSIPNNIFLSMLGALLLLTTYDWALRTESGVAGWVLCCAVASLMIVVVEFSWLSVSMALVFYLFRGRGRAMAVAFIISSLAFTIGMDLFAYREPALWSLAYDWRINAQWMMIFAIIPISFYNQQRGYQSIWGKYGFYLYYPLHIWILYASSTAWE
ncbi:MULTISPECIES: TraX family protein [Paenibacillus]|uniref:TraX family protein n=1 Tax=Paenibacillus TaxID=44249 RepID=UPI00227DADA7|nr:TraX family protein [Paenibacillus alvei]MCY7486303.1 conjugal transfer protein TraX [Paenibacillus alvei]